MTRKILPKNKKSTGFVGMVFLAIALIGIVISAIANMSRSSSQSTANEANRMLAAEVIKKAEDYRNALEILFQEPREPTAAQIRAAEEKSPVPKRVLTLSEADFYPGDNQFFYRRGYFYMPGIDYPLGNTGSYPLVMPYIKKEICLQINSILYGDSLSLEPATAAVAEASVTSSTRWEDRNKTAVNYLGRYSGCLKTSDGKYFYFNVIHLMRG